MLSEMLVVWNVCRLRADDLQEEDMPTDEEYDRIDWGDIVFELEDDEPPPPPEKIAEFEAQYNAKVVIKKKSADEATPPNGGKAPMNKNDDGQDHFDNK